LNYTLRVHKLNWSFLESTAMDPIPFNDHYSSNLCNATIMGIDYLNQARGNSKFLITVPWQTPTDELACLLSINYSLTGIYSFTAKIFDQIDLSLVEMTFGAYSGCSYLFENHTELLTANQPWSYILGAISDFICYSTEIPLLPGGNFSIQLLVMSTLDANAMYNFSMNISEIIEEDLAYASNFTYLLDRDFDVEILSINNSNIGSGRKPKPPIGKEMYTVLINAMVITKDIAIRDFLEYIARQSLFGALVNASLSNLLEGYRASAIVYSVNHVQLNFTFPNVSLNATAIPIPSTTLLPETTPVVLINKTTIAIYNTTAVIRPQHAATSVLQRIKNFFRHLAVWMIILMAIGACLVVSILICLCGFCLRTLVNGGTSSNNGGNYDTCDNNENV